MSRNAKIGPETPPDRSLRRTLLVISALVVGLAITGVGGAALFGAKTAYAGKTPGGPVFTPLPPLEFVLTDGERVRQVDLNVVLELPRGLEPAEMNQRVARIASALNARMVEVDPEDLRGPGGTQRVKDVVGAAADRELRPMRVRQVLLQKLVMR